MSNKTESISSHVGRMADLRNKNDEYLRGYREGKQDAAKELAALVDKIMGNFNHIGVYQPWLGKENVHENAS